jgi:hypothetical protein
MASGRRSWHDRPIFAPVVWGLTTACTGAMSFCFGWLLTRSIRSSIYMLLFMETLAVLYLLESYRSSRSEAHDADSPRSDAQ